VFLARLAVVNHGDPEFLAHHGGEGNSGRGNPEDLVDFVLPDLVEDDPGQGIGDPVHGGRAGYGLAQIDVVRAPLSRSQNIIPEFDGVILNEEDANLFHQKKFLFLPDFFLDFFDSQNHGILLASFAFIFYRKIREKSTEFRNK
jgi:hypothetical protein